MEDFNWESKIVSIVISVLISFCLNKLGCGKILSAIGGEAAGAKTEKYLSPSSSSQRYDNYYGEEPEAKDYSPSNSFSSSSYSTSSSLETKCQRCAGDGYLYRTRPCDNCYNMSGRVSCIYCRGTGIYGYGNCNACNGWGMVNCYTCGGSGQILESTTCFDCNGTGYE